MRSSRSLFRKKAPQRWSAVRGSGRGEPRSGGCIVGTGAVLADQRSGWRRVPRSGKSCSAPCETGRSWRDLQCTWNRAQASCGFACGRRLYMTVQAKFNSPGHKKSPAPRGSVRGSWAWKPEKPLEAVRGRDAVPVKSRPADGRGSGHQKKSPAREGGASAAVRRCGYRDWRQSNSQIAATLVLSP
jgi:hypothetical protein